jgi:tRNA/tmRNA/rRNA uracil-C5-methylase (TrmA/RlmC/RlmD family)
VPRQVIDRLLASSAGLRAVAYVSCDPATLARDIAVFAGHGWRLDELRAFDIFPMTHHVECVAALAPS